MKTLLLNHNFEPLAFISERKAIRLLVKEKVDILSLWTGVKYYFSEGFIELPSVIRLKYEITRRAIKMVFSRGSVFKRDNFGCQYCGKALNSLDITMDHIIPKSMGGRSSFGNCVSSCKTCNLKKGAMSLEEAGMKLLKEPHTPDGYLIVAPKKEQYHPLWDLFLNLE